MMEMMETTEWRKSPHVIGIPPRSVFAHDEEDRAWALAMQAARGRIHPTPVYANRRIIGITQGCNFPDTRVQGYRFPQRHRFRWSEMEQLREDMLWAGFPDFNSIINNLSVNLQFGRRYFGKTEAAFSVANNWYDLWPVTGDPPAGAINNTAFTATNCSDSTVGGIYHSGNVSTATKHLLSKWMYVSANTPLIMLYDRVLIYDLCTFNAAANKTLTNSNTAARYNTAAPGLLICTPVNGVTGATAANLTALHYTNQAGTTLQAMPTTPTVTAIPSVATSTSTLGARNVFPSTSGATVQWSCFLPLAQGDTGCRLVNDYTTSAANTGSFTILLMKPLTDLVFPIGGSPMETDNVFEMPELERIYDGACLALYAFAPITTTPVCIQGGIRYGWA